MLACTYRHILRAMVHGASAKRVEDFFRSLDSAFVFLDTTVAIMRTWATARPSRGQSSKSGADAGWSLRDPARVVEARTPAGVPAALGDVERLTRDAGYYAVGFVAYEAGAAFGLGCGGGRDRRTDCRSPGSRSSTRRRSAKLATARSRRRPAISAGHTSVRRASLTRGASTRRFDRIKTHLAAGDTYQVNFTFKMRAPFDGDPAWPLCRPGRSAQDGPLFGVPATRAISSICSASPELFFALDGLDIVGAADEGHGAARPDARRGRTAARGPAANRRRSAPRT